MKEKVIIEKLRHHLDEEMMKKGFRFNNKSGNYLKFDSLSQLYFEVSFLFLNFVAPGTNHKSKYLEIYLNIYHSEISQLLKEITARGKNLDSFFYFKIVGNMLPDIVLNPDWCNYKSRNNHNYFQLTFVTEEDIKTKSEETILLIEKEVWPFFEKLNSLEKIKNELDACYDKGIAIHNVNDERLLALSALLFYSKDQLKETKLQKIKDHFNSINHPKAIAELNSLIQRFAINS